MLSVRQVVLWSAEVSALVCGVCLSGAWFWWRGARTEVAVHDDEGRVAARLLTRGKMTELVFYSATGGEVATLGVDRFSAERHLIFRDSEGALTGGWVHSLDSGAGTIYLGDHDKAARVLLGAEYGDIMGAPPEAWGLVVQPGPGLKAQVAARAVRREEPVNWIGSVIVANGKRTAQLVP